MDIVTVMTRIGSFLPLVVMFFQTIIFTVGGYLVFKGLMDFAAIGDPSGRGVSYNYQPSVGSASTKVAIGMIMLDLASLHFVGTLTRSFTGDFVSSRLMTYDAAGMDTSGSLMVNAVISMGLRLLQLVGLVGMYDALMSAVHRGEGRSNASYWRITGSLLGGMACWSFHYFANIILNTLGISASVIF